jgi:hypothetical protein
VNGRVASFVDLETAKLLLPLVEGGLADAMAVAQISDGRAGLSLLEDVNDWFFGVSGSLHGFGFVENLCPEPAQPQGGSSGSV